MEGRRRKVEVVRQRQHQQPGRRQSAILLCDPASDRHPPVQAEGGAREQRQQQLKEGEEGDRSGGSGSVRSHRDTMEQQW